MERFVNSVLKYIRENELIHEGDFVAVGFSGGADSVCLLTVLNELRPLLKIKLAAIHVNHNLRGQEAARDEAFCARMAESLGVRFEAVSVDVTGLKASSGMTEEEAGRVLRYEALRKTAVRLAGEMNGTAREACGTPEILIAVAHHADDQAETLLLNLFRGSGLKGLCGMRSRRNNIIRPLLGTGRSDIEAFLKKHGIECVTDSTNLENDHARNRLRNIIMPEVKRDLNGRAAEHAAAAAEALRQAEDFITQEAERYAAGNFTYPQEGSLCLGQQELKEKPQIFRIYVIIEALKALGVPLKDWGDKHFRDVDRALFKHGGYHVDLPGGVYAENGYRETVLYYTGKGAMHGLQD